MKRYHYIYEITNLINGKTYIGQHSTEHLHDGYMGGGLTLNRAIKKYGRNNFKKEILMFAVNNAALNFMEKCLVTEEFVQDESNYNLRIGGGHFGKHSTATKQKMSQSQKGKIISATARQKISISLRGRKRTAESAKKTADALRGRKRPSEVGEKISKSRMGVKFTQEHIKNMSLSRMGKITSEATKRKLSIAHKGRKKNPESVARSIESRRGFKHSEESKRKISESQIGRKHTVERNNKIAKTIPPIINLYTGEFVEGEINRSSFTKKRQLGNAQFGRMLNGEVKSYRGWILF
jgi:group I intron endonuclease